jgi:DnaJ domain
MGPAGDPYKVLGVTPEVSDGELRRAYRALVKRHHPDHNSGSPESSARFAQIQEAYASVARAREAAGPSPNRAAGRSHPSRGSEPATRAAGQDPGIEQRIADLERELAATRAAGRKARPTGPMRSATAGGAYAQPPKPTPEDLGHYETDDSFTSIIDDAAAGLGERLKGARRGALSRRLTDLFGGNHEEQ